MSIGSKIEKLTKGEFIEKLKTRNLPHDEAISKLSEQLYLYEKKYNMRSEVFYRLIVGTPAEDVPDFISWAMCYRSYFRAIQSKFSIEEMSKNVG